MSQQYKLGKGNTNVFASEGMTRVIFHSTAVVSWSDKEIILNTGGWETATTKTRMNQASHQFELGYYVFAKNFQWFVRWGEQDIPFECNTVTLERA